MYQGRGNCRVCEGRAVVVGESLKGWDSIEKLYGSSPTRLLFWGLGFLHLELGHHITKIIMKGCKEYFCDPNARKRSYWLP